MAASQTYRNKFLTFELIKALIAVKYYFREVLVIAQDLMIRDFLNGKSR